jgi:hypothetical protein
MKPSYDLNGNWMPESIDREKSSSRGIGDRCSFILPQIVGQYALSNITTTTMMIK